ncbi:hypothetical protein LINPERHAP1_LOCUS304, partial [Linum perenne]
RRIFPRREISRRIPLGILPPRSYHDASHWDPSPWEISTTMTSRHGIHPSESDSITTVFRVG